MWGILCLYFSLCGTLSSLFFSRFIGSKGVGFLTIGSLFLSFLCSVFAFFDVFALGTFSYVILFTWVDFLDFFVPWSFLFDSLSTIMLSLVTSISFLVHIYAFSYMEGDPHKSRFMSYLSIFTFFMLFLVSSANLLQLFIGWEGIGLSSYLLIGFWFTRFQATQAAFKAVLVNRIGDFGFVLATVCIFFYFGTLDFCSISFLFSDLGDFNISFFGYFISFSTFISFFLILSAMSKSSQIGLHTWLPDAMEGPTPVSALIHAATLVTAGIFLVVRFSFIIEKSIFALSLIGVLGSLTACLGSTIGLYQYDIKRVIAYSTCSQLGYMFYACGLSSYDLAMFHLVNHAYFKALLFLGAGSVIHALFDEQDMRKMGNLVSFLPFTHFSMFLGTLGLIGFPFLGGYYSKDLIIETSFYSGSSFIYWIGIFSAVCGSFYSFRLLYYVFYAPPSSNLVSYKRLSEASFLMSFSIFCLSIFTIFIGYFFSESVGGFGSDFWSNSIFSHYSNTSRFDSEFSFYYLKLVTLFSALFGCFLSIFLHSKFPYYLFSYSFFRNFFLFFNRKWFFDQVYNYYFVRTSLFFGYKSVLNYFDRGFLEITMPSFFSKSSSFFSSLVSTIQSGYVYHYFFLFLLGLSYLFFSNFSVLPIFFFLIFPSFLSFFF